MRQLGSGSQLENSKFYKSMDRDPTIGNISRMAVSQSAPHTPVSTPNHSDGVNLKTVPRLLSEPLVSGKNTSPGIRSLDGKIMKTERIAAHLERQPSETKDTCEILDSSKASNRSGSVRVPVHSPKCIPKKESKFSFKSPLSKRDTKIQLENNYTVSQDRIKRTNILDGTDV